MKDDVDGLDGIDGDGLGCCECVWHSLLRGITAYWCLIEAQWVYLVLSIVQALRFCRDQFHRLQWL
jgi:hypothetical protein